MNWRTIRKAAEAQGWRVDETKKGFMLYPPDPTRSPCLGSPQSDRAGPEGDRLRHAAPGFPLAPGEESEVNWSVRIELAGKGPAPDPGDLFDLLEYLAPLHASVTGSPEEPADGRSRYGASLLVEAEEVSDAVTRATSAFFAGVTKFGLPAWPLGRVEVMSEEELDAELARPSFPRLLGIAELARLLDTSKQRASQVARTAAFPKPVAELAAGPVWTEPSVRRFVEHWTRTPGRPRKRVAEA